jgi:hypothetical protein
VTNYTSKSAYLAAAGPQSEITFGEFPVGTIVTNQYAPLGVIFTDGDDHIGANSTAFADGVGLPADTNVNGLVTLSFSSPQNAVAADFPGQLNISLYSGTTLVGTSATFGGSGVGFFGGVQSSVPFNKVVLEDLFDHLVAIDNLYIPNSVPEPASLMGIVCAFAAVGRRPRTRGHRNVRM